MTCKRGVGGVQYCPWKTPGWVWRLRSASLTRTLLLLPPPQPGFLSPERTAWLLVAGELIGEGSRDCLLVGKGLLGILAELVAADRDRLARRGERIADDSASGTLAKRPALTEAFGYLREGDSLVVTKLDRLGRSVRNLKQVADELQQRGVGVKALSQGIDTTTPGGRLFFHMLAAIAEFEHDLIVERTHDGLAAARARGRKGGPKFKMTPTKIRQARAMYDEGGHTVQEIADTFGVSRPTIYRHLAEHVERA